MYIIICVQQLNTYANYDKNKFFSSSHAVAMVDQQSKVDSEYNILKILQKNPSLSQRKVAKEMGLSLGKTNYIIHALIEKGLIKLSNFKRSDNKIAYLYLLTPKGVAARSILAKAFLERKIDAFEKLQSEIKSLKREIND